MYPHCMDLCFLSIGYHKKRYFLPQMERSPQGPRHFEVADQVPRAAKPTTPSRVLLDQGRRSQEMVSWTVVFQY